jgi:hypothetical protein
MNHLVKPPVRDSKIPCQECKKGTLFWNPEESVYVCTNCGVQAKALETWIASAQHRQNKKRKIRERDRKWALNILGIEDKLEKSKKSRKEEEWDELMKKVKEKGAKSINK